MSALDTIPTSRRRWLRFSLRSFLIATAFVGLFFGWVGHEVRRGRELQQTIEELNLTTFKVDSSIPRWLQSVLGELFLARVNGGVAYPTTNRDLSLKYLERLQPTALNFDGTRISDAFLARLQGMTHLELLELYGTRVTDAGLAHLRGLGSLRCLHLSGTRITDAGLAHLRELPHLEELSLRDLPITDAGLAHLAGVVSLKKLALDRTNVTGAGLCHLTGCTKLTHLTLDATGVDDAGLGHLAGLRHLQSLSLSNTKITDTGLVHLQGMGSHRDPLHLCLRNTATTWTGVKMLRQATSNCVNVNDYGRE